MRSLSKWRFSSPSEKLSSGWKGARVLQRLPVTCGRRCVSGWWWSVSKWAMDLKIRLGHRSYALCMHRTAGSRFSSRTSPSSPANEPLSWRLLAGGGGSVAAFQHQYREDDAIRSASMRSKNRVVVGIWVGLKHVMSCVAIWTGHDRIGARECVVFVYDVQDGAGAPAVFLWSEMRTSWYPSRVDVP
jgi:hypothetical protein